MLIYLPISLSKLDESGLVKKKPKMLYNSEQGRFDVVSAHVCLKENKYKRDHAHQ
jgi:hexokinase